jgi:DNA-binding beta-propeller fold protein YncE
MQRCTASTLIGLAGLGLAELTISGLDASEAQRGPAAPAYQVDPMWPKPLPNGWILGSVTGVAVDGRDHIWLVHRGGPSLTARTENGLGTNPPTAELCCRPAPPVLEFDAAGTLISSFGGPGQGYDWPQSPGGIAVDPKGNVWVVAAGFTAPAGRGGRGGRAGRGGEAPAAPPAGDAHILKFSPKGQHLMTIGKAGATGPGDAMLNRPANIDFDPTGGEIFVADGHVNHRIAVFDAATGAFKRQWSGHGTPFKTVSCVSVARDGMAYVCDRENNRVQVFRTDGTFVKEAVIARETLGAGAVWDVAFSSDPKQQYLFVADGQNQRVRILVRDSLAEVGGFGAGGRWPGHFYAVGSVAVDSRGNVYTGEALEGKRLQKWLPRQASGR